MILSRSIIFFLVIFLPLVYFPLVFNPYEFPKFVVFLTIVEAIIIFSSIDILQKKSLNVRFDWLTILVIAFGLVIFISDILGIDPKISFLGSTYRHQGFVTFLSGITLFLFARSILHVKPEDYGKAVVLSAFLVSLFAMWQWINYFIFHNFAMPTYQGRVVGTLGNPNFLGGYLAMTLPFIFLGKPWLLLRILSAALVIFIIFISQSRAAIIAALVILFLSFLYTARLKWRKALWLIVFMMVFVSSIYPFGLLQLKRDSIWDNRGFIWQEGIQAVVKRPILGYGQENFELVFPSERQMKVDNAHNIFLETAVSSGIIGLLLFLGIIAAALYKANVIVKLSLLAFLMVAQFNPLSIAQISLFWLLVGSCPQPRESLPHSFGSG